jgi:phosphohistidine phosphatase SixA
MRVGMIAVLAAAALATTDDTSKVVGSVLRFAARAAGIGAPIPAPSLHHPHVRVALTPSKCGGRIQTRDQPAVPHPTVHRVTHVSRRLSVNDSIIDALRSGGLVIVFRHSITDHSQPDSRQISLTDRATQRNLTPAGVEQAKRVGEMIRLLRVPVDEVFASPLFRTMDTATNAFGQAEPSGALWRTGTAADRLRLLADPPRAGTNRVLVTHNFVLVAVFPGMRPGDLREGDAMVVRPLGNGKFDVVGQVRADDWARLAEPPGARPSGAKSL